MTRFDSTSWSLVLGTAERAESPSAIAAAGKIAKMCGYLPLYVT